MRGVAAQPEVVFPEGGTSAAHIGDPAMLGIQFGAKLRSCCDIGYIMHEAV